MTGAPGRFFDKAVAWAKTHVRILWGEGGCLTSWQALMVVCYHYLWCHNPDTTWAKRGSAHPVLRLRRACMKSFLCITSSFSWVNMMIGMPGKLNRFGGLKTIGIQEQSNTTTRIQCHEINFQNKLNLKVY